jgi:hypothetical protein
MYLEKGTNEQKTFKTISLCCRLEGSIKIKLLAQQKQFIAIVCILVEGKIY